MQGKRVVHACVYDLMFFLGFFDNFAREKQSIDRIFPKRIFLESDVFNFFLFPFLGKKGKKGKGKKISLQEFVQVPGGTGVTQVQVPTKLSWADECDEDDDNQSTNTKIIELPTAPRAARLLNDDCVPTNAPFLAYLSNLPYDVEDVDIDDFFRDFNVVTVRLPRDEDAGKSRGYGYVEFETREELIDALSMPDPTIRGRRIKIDLTSDNEGRRRNNRYGNDNYGSSDRNNTNWRDRQDGGFSGGRDNVDGGRRRNDYGNRRNNDRDPVVVEAGEEGSWRMGDRPKYSPPRERKQYDRPAHREDRDHNNFRDGRDGRDRFGGRRRNDYERPPMQDEEPMQGERPKLNLQPRTLPMPELTFPKEEQIPTAFKGDKQNGDVDQEHDDVENADKVHENGEHQPHHDEAEEKPAPKPRGVPSAAVFGDAKPVDTAAKEREVEEKLAQRRLELKQKAEEDRKRLAESKENESSDGDKDGANENGHDDKSNGDQQPKSLEPVKSWRTKDDDNRPRNRNYSPERDNRGGPPRRQGGKTFNKHPYISV